jgi:hypothetical protein
VGERHYSLVKGAGESRAPDCPRSLPTALMISENTRANVQPSRAEWDQRQDDVFAGPVGHRLARQFGAVVAAQHGWVAAGQCEAVQFVDQGVGGDAAPDQLVRHARACSSMIDTSLTIRSVP